MSILITIIADQEVTQLDRVRTAQDQETYLFVLAFYLSNNLLKKRFMIYNVHVLIIHVQILQLNIYAPQKLLQKSFK